MSIRINLKNGSRIILEGNGANNPVSWIAGLGGSEVFQVIDYGYIGDVREPGQHEGLGRGLAGRKDKLGPGDLERFSTPVTSEIEEIVFFLPRRFRGRPESK